MIESLIIFLILGCIVGFLAGLLGIGGGTVLVPVLTSVFIQQGIPLEIVVHLALGTSMASIVLTSIASFRAHHKKGAVLWGVVKQMAPWVVIGSFAATYLAANMRSIELTIFFSVFLLLVSVQMFLNKQPKPSRTMPNGIKLSSAAGGIGAISSMVAIGGGALNVPFMVWHNIPITKAIGTAAALGFPIALAGSLGYLINGWNFTNEQNLMAGYIYFPAVVAITATSFFIAPFGAKLAHSLPTAIIKKIFAIFLLLLCAKMVLSII